jgi:hypothetical protein
VKLGIPEDPLSVAPALPDTQRQESSQDRPQILDSRSAGRP